MHSRLALEIGQAGEGYLRFGLSNCFDDYEDYANPGSTRQTGPGHHGDDEYEYEIHHFEKFHDESRSLQTFPFFAILTASPVRYEGRRSHSP